MAGDGIVDILPSSRNRRIFGLPAYRPTRDSRRPDLAIDTRIRAEARLGGAQAAARCRRAREVPRAGRGATAAPEGERPRATDEP
jgi:hypothetical protein